MVGRAPSAPGCFEDWSWAEKPTYPTFLMMLKLILPQLKKISTLQVLSK